MAQHISPFSYMAERLFVRVMICRPRPLFPLVPAELDCSAVSMRSRALVKESAASEYRFALKSALPSRSISSMRRWRAFSLSSFEAEVVDVAVEREDDEDAGWTLDLVGVAPKCLPCDFDSSVSPSCSFLARDSQMATPAAIVATVPRIMSVV